MAQIKVVGVSSQKSLRNTRNSNSRSLPARESFKRNCKRSIVSQEIKRKPTGSPSKDKNKKKTTLKTPVANKDCVSLDNSAMAIPHKRLTRHGDICLKNKIAPKPLIKEKTKNTSTTKTKQKPSKPRKNILQQSNSISSSHSEISQLSNDSLTRSQADTKKSKKLPKSAPAVKRKSNIADLRTPIPKKGTLKRQRWMFNSLKEKNEGHEDDIFENQKFQTPVFRLLNEVTDESDSSIPTPKFLFGLTPALPKKTPTSKETISSSDLLLARKNAEEYLYRRNRKRVTSNLTLNSSSKSKKVYDEVPEKKKLEFAEAIEKVETISKEIEDETEEDTD